jgi:hypothetical protein
MDSSRDHRLLQYLSYLGRTTTVHYGCEWASDMILKPSPTDRGDARQDLSNTYHLMHSTEGDKYKPAYRTIYTQCNSQVVPFALATAQASTPIRGYQSLAEQQPPKRGMRLPAVPEWNTRVHITNTDVQRHPESGDKVSRRIM